jgi:Uma2 family endonuclease
MARPQPADVAAGFYTADMVRALNEANPRWWPRYEAVEGELLVSPAPGEPHAFVVTELLAELVLYLRRHPVGVAYASPADISWGRRDTTVQPDVFVVPPGVFAGFRRGGGWLAATHLRLAVEVVSPRTRKADRFTKRTLYQRRGVELYWAVDPERRLAEAWTPEADLPVVEREQLVWAPADAAEPFAFDLAARFARLDAGA